MISTLHISGQLRDHIAKLAGTAFPKECCGLIEGRRDGDAVHADAIHPMRNLADSADRFEIDPAEQIALMRALRGTQRGIVGCYHSHPNGRGEPSQRDLENAAEEEFLWLIAAVGQDGKAKLSAFVFRGGAFARLRLARAQDPKV